MWPHLHRQTRLSHGQAVHHFQISSPTGPSRLVLLDSLIISVIQSGCSAQPWKSCVENNVINTVSFAGSYL